MPKGIPEELFSLSELKLVSFVHVIEHVSVPLNQDFRVVLSV